MEPILTIDNLNSFGGNMLRQGDKSQLKYRLRDVGNKNLSISSKPCQVKMYGRNYTTVVYETSTTVSSDNTVSFTIDKVLPKGTFYLEFTVGDYIFPTDHREFFEITPSGKGMEANIIEIAGKDVLINAVKSQVDAELQPLVTSLESAEQAETQRVSAESSRVSAEAQRVTDHANRSAELAGKADKVVIRNIIENGDFSNGQIGWMDNPGYNNRFEVVDGVARSIETDLGNQNPDRSFITDVVSIPAGHKVYSNIKLKVTDPTKVREVSILYGLAGRDGRNYLPLPSSDFDNYSGLLDWTTGTRIRIMTTFNTTEDVPDIYLDYAILLDLTETFGIGNEPTKEEMDKLIEVTGYINDEYALNNKEMLGHLMKGIRGKANKKQEDWITPTLVNGWETYSNSPFQYRKDSMGMVHLRGRLNPVNKTDISFCHLPISYRPSIIKYLNWGNDFYIAITPTGQCQNYFTKWVSLDGFSFEAEVN